MSSSYLFASRSELDDAIGAWLADESAATEIYGDINTWDVSQITDFSKLFFLDNKDFNSDISLWDVGNGTDFSLMFYGTSFNQDISAWDVAMQLILLACLLRAQSLIKT